MRGMGDKEEEDEEAAGGHEEAGHGEGEAPAGVDIGAGNQGAEDVAEGGVRVPEAHDEAAPAFPKPIGHHGHHAWNKEKRGGEFFVTNSVYFLASKTMVPDPHL